MVQLTIIKYWEKSNRIRSLIGDMVDRKKLLVTVIGLFFVGVCLLQIHRMANVNSEYRDKIAVLEEPKTRKQEYINNLDRIKELILKNGPAETTADIIRAVMEFVHDNSLHLVDDEHSAYAYDGPLVTKKLLLAYQGQKNEKPHLSCGPRSCLTRDLLTRLGITSRPIQLFSTAHKDVQGHRLLEVFNPETQTWEVWDPDYRVTYVDALTKKSVDIMAILFGDLEKILPKDGNTEGWKETHTEELKEDNYFGAALFEVPPQQIQYSVIIINLEKFDIHKAVSDGLTFKDWTKKYYGNIRLILLRYRN
jgi:hypothetical protein